MKEELILFGCGGHSRSVADIILSGGVYQQLVFVDQNARENEEIFGFPVLREHPLLDRPYFFAIGDNEARHRKLLEVGPEYLISVVSEKAYFGVNASYGKGCFVGNFSHIGPDVRIGANTIINNAAIVEHEVTVGDHCHIGPGSVISGRCNISDLVFVGVGAIVKDYIQICPNVTIGAGATVVCNITEPGVYVGTPARRIK